MKNIAVDIDQTSVMHEYTCWRRLDVMYLFYRYVVHSALRFLLCLWISLGLGRTWTVIASRKCDMKYIFVNFHFDGRCQRKNKLTCSFCVKSQTHSSCNNLFTESDRRSEQQLCQMNKILFLYTNATNENTWYGTVNSIAVSKTHQRCMPHAVAKCIFSRTRMRYCVCVCVVVAWELVSSKTTKYRRCVYISLFCLHRTKFD